MLVVVRSVITACLMMSTTTTNKSIWIQHPYVVIETPERKYYYEVMGLVIVPEDTAFTLLALQTTKTLPLS